MSGELMPIDEQDERIFAAWKSGKGQRAIAREMGIQMAVEQALDRALPVFNQQSQARAYKRHLFLMEDLETEFYAIAKRDKSIDAAHLCARLNERICAMSGWSSMSIRMDPLAAQTAQQLSSYEKITQAITRIAHRERFANNGHGPPLPEPPGGWPRSKSERLATPLAPPSDPSTDDQNHADLDDVSTPQKDATCTIGTRAFPY